MLLYLFFLSLSLSCSSSVHQLSEVEVNGQIEQVYSEMQSQAMGRSMDTMDTMDTLPMPGCFRMRSHSYVRAIDQGCAGEEEGEGGRPLLLLPSSPPRTSATTVRTIQSSTGKQKKFKKRNGSSWKWKLIALQVGWFRSCGWCSKYTLDPEVWCWVFSDQLECHCTLLMRCWKYLIAGESRSPEWMQSWSPMREGSLCG